MPVNVGQELSDMLKAQARFDYQLMDDEAAARAKVKQGQLAFALIIPKNFSANAVPGEQVGAGQLVVFASQGNHLESARIAQQFATELGHKINESLNTKRWSLVLVNAAGAWVDQVAAMAGVQPLGFTPNRRSMARIPAPGGHDISGWPMVFGAGETWYAKPDAGALIVSPAEEHPQEPHDAWADDMVLAEGLARYEEFVIEPVTRMISNWAGLRTFSPDRVPVIGRDLREPSFFWLAGQGGYGFQSCPAASRLAADLIGGRQTEIGADLVAALNPARFG